MTLDPVHFDGISQLARRIDASVDADDHREFAETVWDEFLDPLWDADREVKALEPLGEQARRKVAIEDVALREDEFPTRHGLDSGTINPTTFKNGLVLDVAQAAMAAVPSDLDLHRARTVVATVHSNDATVDCDEDDWTVFDGGYSRGRVLQAPRVSRFEEAVVHALSLYLAESHHALTEADVVDDLLVLDGPVYPKGLLRWADRDPELADLLVEDERPRDVVENYVRLVETFVERGVPLLGFVKNSTSKALTRRVRAERSAPWVDDAALFSRVLERRERVDSEYERLDEHLTYTNWFTTRCGVDRDLSTAGDAFGIDRDLDEEAYEVTFFVVYDPRDDLAYRVEAPYAFTRDPDRREALTMQALKGVAVERGPPLSVAKADELARISREEKAALSRSLEETFDSDRSRDYDDQRWGFVAE
jgi:hypothetical protein